jgi:cytochrome b involved in lipid metabolism
MGNSLPYFTREDVEKRDKWIIIDNKIYDVSTFKDHPPPYDVFAKVGGTDCTIDFHLIHKNSSIAYKLMNKYLIGYIKN